jgi:hypothetical protein
LRMSCSFDESICHDDSPAIHQRPRDGRCRDAFVQCQFCWWQLALNYFNGVGQLWARPMGAPNSDASRVYQAEIMQGEYGVVCQVGVSADSQYGFHEFVAVGSGNVVETVEPVSNVLQATAMRKLAQFH